MNMITEELLNYRRQIENAGLTREDIIAEVSDKPDSQILEMLGLNQDADTSKIMDAVILRASRRKLALAEHKTLIEGLDLSVDAVLDQLGNRTNEELIKDWRLRDTSPSGIILEAINKANTERNRKEAVKKLNLPPDANWYEIGQARNKQRQGQDR